MQSNYSVYCPKCGLVDLSQEQYDQQLAAASELWYCLGLVDLSQQQLAAASELWYCPTCGTKSEIVEPEDLEEDDLER